MPSLVNGDYSKVGEQNVAMTTCWTPLNLYNEKIGVSLTIEIAFMKIPPA
jgi:hypothetical protein